MAEIGWVEGTEQYEKNRQLHDGMLWERGRVVFVGDGIFLTPQPAEDEYMLYLLPGSNGPVFSLLDPHRSEDRPWIEEERRIYEGNGMELAVLPIPVDPYDGHVALAVADRIRRSPGSKVVHAFLRWIRVDRRRPKPLFRPSIRGCPRCLPRSSLNLCSGGVPGSLHRMSPWVRGPGMTNSRAPCIVGEFENLFTWAMPRIRRPGKIERCASGRASTGAG